MLQREISEFGSDQRTIQADAGDGSDSPRSANSVEVIEATLTTHGKVGFVSREVGRMSDTDPYLLNTALYYALGLAQGNYVDTSHQPTYKRDTAATAANTYITPGKPVATADGTEIPSDSPSVEYITTNRNARSDSYATPNLPAKDDRNEYADLNTPSFEQERCFLPENTFRFYIFLAPDSPHSIQDLPRYIRLGKDRGKCRVDYREVPFETHSGTYSISHPMSAYDHTDKPDAGVVMKKIPPLTLWIEATFEGQYISIDPDSDDPVAYPHPEELEFLKTRGKT